MKDTHITYGTKGIIIVNYDKFGEILSEMPVLYHKILFFNEHVGFSEGEYYVNLHFMDIAGFEREEISILSNDKNIVLEHMEKIKEKYLQAILDKVGI